MHPLARLGLLAVVVTLALASFTWPSGSLEPRGLPVGVVGATPAGLGDAEAFDLHRYATEAAAREAVLDREVYGAVAGSTLLVATGASPAVAAALREAAPGARVVDLAPGTRADPRAATLASLAMPLTLIGILTALLTFFTARSTRERLGLIAGGAVVGGVAAATLTSTWLDAVPGSWLGIAGVVALGVGAVASAITGLAARIGRPGVGLGAVLMMLVGNPWSGLSSAPELLPRPAAEIGQLLPTGAAGNLLRSVAFFDGAAAGPYLVVLAAWIVGGVALVVTASVRQPIPHGHGAAATA